MANNIIPILTILDKKNACLLEGSQTLGFIIEGNTDYIVYLKMLEKSNIKWDNIDFVIAKSKNDFLKHYKEGIEFKYIALLDADYERIEDNLIMEDFIIYTDYYCMENYLTCSDVISITINDFNSLKNKVSATKLIEEAINQLYPYIVLCYTKLKENWPITIEKLKIYRWWNIDKYSFNKDLFIEYIIKELNEKWKPINEEEIHKLYNKYEIEIKEKNYFYDLILNGKRKLEVIHSLFVKYYKLEMENRNLKIFKFDLLKNIHCSQDILNLVSIIDNKFTNLISK